MEAWQSCWHICQKMNFFSRPLDWLHLWAVTLSENASLLLIQSSFLWLAEWRVRRRGEKRQRFYRNKRDQSSSLKCQVCLRNKVLFFNSSPCFLFFLGNFMSLPEYILCRQGNRWDWRCWARAGSERSRCMATHCTPAQNKQAWKSVRDRGCA